MTIFMYVRRNINKEYLFDYYTSAYKLLHTDWIFVEKLTKPRKVNDVIYETYWTFSNQVQC